MVGYQFTKFNIAKLRKEYLNNTGGNQTLKVD